MDVTLADRPMVRGLGQVKAGVLKEAVPFLKFGGVGLAWTVLDYFGHQTIGPLRGDKTPPGYFGNKLLFSVPTLILGRLASDAIGGAPGWRAVTLGTTANALMQLRYVFTMPSDFNIACFLLHQVILIPLSFLLIGAPGKSVYGEAARSAAGKDDPYGGAIVPEGT